jgi:non-homologous end joining protein Ku
MLRHPQPGGRAGVWLLGEAAPPQGKAGVAKAAFGAKEPLFCLIEDGYGISAASMRFAEETRPAPSYFHAPQAAEAEPSLALRSFLP